MHYLLHSLLILIKMMAEISMPRHTPMTEVNLRYFCGQVEPEEGTAPIADAEALATHLRERSFIPPPPTKKNSVVNIYSRRLSR